MHHPALVIFPSETSDYETIRRKGLSIGIMLEPPQGYACFVIENRNLCPDPGLSVEFLRLMCEVLAVPCKFIKVNHTSHGQYIAGEWNGMVRQIMDGEFDTSNINFTP